mmetsp:Transcript_32046/g.74696  ORF Transcript_32046/g.74696 Transcript_32046/m.74696 type:complete len:218 (-) Transcript_32046:362-1015(-)
MPGRPKVARLRALPGCHAPAARLPLPRGRAAGANGDCLAPAASDRVGRVVLHAVALLLPVCMRGDRQRLGFGDIWCCRAGGHAGRGRCDSGNAFAGWREALGAAATGARGRARAAILQRGRGQQGHWSALVAAARPPCCRSRLLIRLRCQKHPRPLFRTPVRCTEEEARLTNAFFWLTNRGFGSTEKADRHISLYIWLLALCAGITAQLCVMRFVIV